MNTRDHANTLQITKMTQKMQIWRQCIDKLSFNDNEERQ